MATATEGKHVIAELFNSKHIEFYDNEDNIRDLLIECAKAANASILSASTHKFHPKGVSGTLFLEESHFSVHVWTDENYASIDMYTCGNRTEPLKALKLFMKKFGSKDAHVSYVKRGLYNKSAKVYYHEVEEINL